MSQDKQQDHSTPPAKSTETFSIFDPSEGENETRELQIFRAGSLHLGIFADQIATTAPWRLPTPLPHAPPAVLGVVSIQGRMLTVMDPVLLMEDGYSDVGRGFIVALRGDEQLGLAIENKTYALEMAASELIVEFSEMSSPLVLGIVRRGVETIRVLNIKELFPAAIRGRERRRRRF